MRMKEIKMGVCGGGKKRGVVRFFFLFFKGGGGSFESFKVTKGCELL